MGLSHDLISQFVKATNDKQVTKKETIAYGTVVELDGKKYVRLDGSEMLTPVSSTADSEDNERVTVLIKDHTATITGNSSSPAARKQSVDDAIDQITEVEILVSDKVSTSQLDAEKGRIDELVSDNATIKERLTASEASIDNLEADNVTIKETLTAQNGEIENLKVNVLTVDVADAKYATIENLKATDADFRSVKSDYADFKNTTTDNFTAVKASIDDLETNKLSAESAELKYANIDFSNIGEAAVEKFYAVSGIIQNLTLETGVVVKELVGVLISGDLIQANTIQAEKLVVRGEDGLYYKLNIDSLGETTASSDEKYQNGLDGSVIIAKSITAEKVSVDDLVAFGATIGGFKITSKSIYSGVKNSADNTTIGIYLDSDGQMSLGNATSFVKFYKYDDSSYRLEISADSIAFGSTKKNVETVIDEISEIANGAKSAADSAQSDTDALGLRVSTAETNITQNSDQIALRATNEEINDANGEIKKLQAALKLQADSIATLIRNGEAGSLIKQDSDGLYYFDISGLESDVLENTDKLNSLDSAADKMKKDIANLEEITEYVKVGTDENDKPYIELGEGDSSFKVKITNEQIQFIDGQAVPAYVTNEKLMIEEAEVRKELRFGNFVWKKRDNGNMGLIWGEVTS